jgi:hypothetical protein
MYWNYVSCLLTIISTVMVGKRLWHGWMLAGINSVIICFIGFQTRQWGFIPANLFCLAIYVHNIRKWRGPVSQAVEVESQFGDASTAMSHQLHSLSSTSVLSNATPAQQRPRRSGHRIIAINAGDHRFRVRSQIRPAGILLRAKNPVAEERGFTQVQNAKATIES